MLALRHLVAALDLEPGSQGALAGAARLADRTGARLHLVHVESLYHGGTVGLYGGEPSDSVVRLQMERHAARVLGEDVFGTLDVELHVLRDVGAVAGLLRFAEEHPVDLLVLGTHGRRGPRRWVLGSVAAEVVRLAPVPVLTVPNRAAASGTGPEGASVVLAPVDFSPVTPDTVWAASQLAEALGADLHLLHVIEHPGPQPAFYPDIGVPLVLPDVTAGLRERAHTELARLAEPLGLPAEALHVRHGRAAAEIVEAARELGATAIAMGTHGLTGLDRLLTGSVTERALRSVGCPVLTLKSAARWRESALQPA